MLPTLRRKLYVQLDPPSWPTKGLSPLNRLICAAILLATAMAVVETEPTIAHGNERLFGAAELAFGIFFASEYLARLWVVTEVDDRAPAWRRRLRFIFSPSGLIDLAVIATSFAPLLTGNAQMLRLLRLIRIVRLAKLGRMSSAMRYLAEAVASRRMELGLTAGIGVGLMVTGATLLYWIEGTVQPDKFGSIPRSLWWAVITLTTTGYGDTYPIRPAFLRPRSATRSSGRMQRRVTWKADLPSPPGERVAERSEVGRRAIGDRSARPLSLAKPSARSSLSPEGEERIRSARQLSPRPAPPWARATMCVTRSPAAAPRYGAR